MNVILSTAGHIDHGKTYLIEKLAHKNTMHHKEEIMRNITIDLGYANLDIADLNVSVIDVPGHKDYLKNTICGIINSNISMLIISAIDGVCEQTKQHFSIINLSSIENLIICITKIDISDKEMLINTKNQINELVKNSHIKNIKILDIDYATGLDELKKSIYDFSKNIKLSKVNKAIIKIDNSFTVKGHGTVVSGNLVSGSIEDKSKICIYPNKIKTNVKSIQMHSKNEMIAEQYTRIALNIPVPKDEIKRGCVISTEYSLENTYTVEVLLNIEQNIKNHTIVKLFTGTNSINAKIIIINKIENKIFARIHLSEEICCFLRDDVIILDTYHNVIAGGHIINTRSKKAKYNSFSFFENDDLEDKLVFFSIINNERIVYFDDVFDITDFGKDKIIELVDFFVGKNLIIALNELFIKKDFYEKLSDKIKFFIEEYKNTNKIRDSIDLEIIYSKINYIDKKIIEKIISNLDFVVENNKILLNKKNFNCKTMEIMNKLRAMINVDDKLIAIKKINKYDKEILYSYMRAEFVNINDDYIISVKNIEKYKKFLIDFFKVNDKLKISDFKNKFSLSRNDTVLILEYFDYEKFTKRFENYRVKLYN